MQPVTLTTARLLLRTVGPEDTDAVYAAALTEGAVWIKSNRQGNWRASHRLISPRSRL